MSAAQTFKEETYWILYESVFEDSIRMMLDNTQARQVLFKTKHN